VSLAERPDLAPAIPDVLASRWPVFMLAGEPGHDVDLTQLLAVDAPGHQILLIDAEDKVLGVGLSVPIEWDGTAAGLPSGWDGVVAASGALLARGGTPDMVSALSVTISPDAAGRGHAATIVRALKAAAAGVGPRGLLVPVRPILKPQYPLIPFERYLGWRTAAGEVFDPWLRLHQRLGARILAVAEDSLAVTGSVAEWEAWTGLALPESGEYVVPGGLVPLRIDTETGRGTYSEPNVWVLHPQS
jgi:GNAT superfamily N-acetyltransferase